MVSKLFDKIWQGIKKIKEYPQLLYTFGIAFAIFAAFVFTAYQFSQIAIDAQSRLVRIRAGATQDALASFVSNNFDATSTLRSTLISIASNDSTIESLDIVRMVNGKPVIWASAENNKAISPVAEELFSFASSNSNTSFTTEDTGSGGRDFVTVRALENPQGTIAGYIISKQSLSEADQVISDNITRSILIFSVIMLFIFLLFIRHSRIVDYISLYRKLKGIDELKDDFISMASHELRAPLTAIRGYAELLKEPQKTSEENKECVERIDVSAKQLDELVSEMLDVSRIEQGRMVFKMTPLDPKKMNEEVILMFKKPAEDKGLVVTSDLQVGALINVDETRLRQVLINLVSNSLKYTLKGSVVVNVTIEKGQYNICVSDTGVGMSAENQRKLFAKFSRIYNEETRDVRGTGLGLWITKKIVEEMNGNISVESIKDVGSHFIISFPVIKNS